MLVNEQFEVTLYPANMEHYLSLGYKGNCKDNILVWSKDLVPTSKIKILRVCDECGEESRLQMRRYNPICKSCATKIANIDRKDESLTTCECGKPKAYNSAKCKSCWLEEDKTGKNSATYGTKNHVLAERNRNRRPEDHWNYKGGVSKRSGKQIVWATEVKELASNICDCCGYDRGIALVAHHLHSDNTDKGSYEVDNGVCLCQNCHVEFHKKYGFGDNTPEQYIQFKEEY